MTRADWSFERPVPVGKLRPGGTVRGVFLSRVVTSIVATLSLVTSTAAITAASPVAKATAAPAGGPAAAPTVPGAFGSITPVRVLDTRTDTGGHHAPVGSKQAIAVQVDGLGGVPASGVSAVAVNVTVTGETKPGFATVYASGSAVPTASNLNFQAGKTTPNLVIAPVGPDGKIALYNASAGTVQFVADVAGYYLAGTPTVPGAFGSVAPYRVLDTRIGTGAVTAPVAARGSVSVQVAGLGNVPRSGVSAVAVNVTVTGATANGVAVVYADGAARPVASNLNFLAGITVPNLVIAPVGADGKIVIYNGSSGTVQLVADVSGYFRAGSPTSVGAFGSVSPYRVLDTRIATGAPRGAVAAHGSLKVQVAGLGGVPASGVSAVAVNVTVTGPTKSGVATVYADDGSNPPLASNLNFTAGQTVPNLVMAPVGADGKIDIYNNSSGTTQYVADVAGYYLATPPATGSGTVRDWGYDQGSLGDGTLGDRSSTPVQVSGLSGVTAIAGGNYTGYALTSDGHVWAWGANLDGALGNGSTAYSSATPVPVSGLSGVTAIAAGNDTGYALTSNGQVWAWGANSGGALGNGSSVDSSAVPVPVSGLSGVTAIAGGGGNNGYALTSDGHVWAWGSNDDGELGNGTSGPSASSATPVPVSGLSGVTAISAGGVGGAGGNGFALTSAGSVWAWGYGADGELGDGATTSSSTPVAVSGLSGVTAIAGGGFAGYAVTSGGNVWAWGLGADGELGNGATTSSSTPVPVSGLSGVTKVAGGGHSAYAVTSGGSVVAWGHGADGELGNGDDSSAASPVTVTGLTGVVGISGGTADGYALLGS